VRVPYKIQVICKVIDFLVIAVVTPSPQSSPSGRARRKKFEWNYTSPLFEDQILAEPSQLLKFAF
jgi:hypothetical protein